MKNSRTLLIAFFIGITCLSISAQPLSISVELSPPNPQRVSDLQSGLSIQVQNTTTNTYQARYTVAITGLPGGGASGIMVNTRASSIPDLPSFTINGLQQSMLRYSNIQNTGAQLNRDDYDIEVSPEQEAILDAGFLPPGNYQLCVQAFDENSMPLSNITGSNCTFFSVEQFSSPELVRPENNSTVAITPAGNVRFQWMQNFGGQVPAGLRYRLEIFQLQGATQIQQVTPDQLDNRQGVEELGSIELDALPPFYIAGAGAADDNIIFNEGDIYAARLVAMNPAFFTDGRGTSNIVVFAYGENSEFDCAQLDQNDIQAEFTFPSPLGQDTLPFTNFPVIAAFLPECESFSRLSSTLTINWLQGNSQQINRTLNWPNGPRHFLENWMNNHGYDPDVLQLEQGYAYGFNLDAVIPSTFHCYKYVRGGTYQVSASYEMSLSGQSGAAPRKNIEAASFVTGMPLPKLLSPANETVLEEICPVPLRINTGNTPLHPLPTFRVLNIEDGQVSTCGYLSTREKLVLQVARDAGFQQIVFKKFKKIQADAYDKDKTFNEDAFAFEPSSTSSDNLRLYDENAYISKVFGKEYTFQFDPTTVTTGTPAGTYYWRVGWVAESETADGSNDKIRSESDLEGLTNADFYRFSPVYQFEVRNAPCTAPPPQDPDRIEACIAQCEADVVPESERDYLTTYEPSDLVTVGKFEMEIKTIQHRTEGDIGTGEIRIPFMNNARISVAFTNLKVNAARRAWAGTVKARQDLPELIPGNIGEAGATFAGMSETEAAALDNAVNQTTRSVLGLLGTEPIGMPLGFDVVVDSAANRKVTIGIVGMDFSPVKATLNAVFSLDFPELNGWVSLGATDICFYPSGLDLNRATLYSPIEKRIPFGDEVTLVFPAANLAARDTGTYVSWDCRGFRKLVLAGYVEFSRNLLLPDTPSGAPAESGTVKARFKFSAQQADNYMGRLSIDDFQIVGLDGWGFTAQNAFLDFSDLENPTGIRFPRNYQGDKTVHWKGFMLGQAAVRLPQEFRTSSNPNERLTIGIDSLLADRTGLSMSVFVQNIINTGTVEGWRFTLDRFHLQFVSNTMTQGGFNGRIWLPVDQDTPLRYDALLHNTGNNQFGFQFRIQPTARLDAALWGATLQLAGTSIIGINLGTLAHTDRNGDGQVTEIDWREGAYAMLTGSISFGNNSQINLNFPAMEFQNLGVYTWGPYFSCGNISFASPAKEMAGFPINIERFEFVNVTRPALIDVDPNRPGNRIGFSFDLKVTIMEGNNAFQATVNLGILARVNYANGALDVGFGGIDFNELAVEGSVGTVHIRGGLKLFRRDDTYGDGFKGWLDATFKPTIRLKAVAQFGSVNGFDYWMVDASAEFSPGITLFAGVALNGFCGGAWGNMTMQSTAASLHNNISQAGQQRPASEQLREPGSSGSGLRYIPSRGAFGFRAGLIFGPNAGDAYRAKVVFAANFNSSGNISLMTLDGELVVLPQQNSNGTPPIYGTLHAEYDFEHSTFLANVEVFVNVASIIRGSGPGNRAGRIQMYASPSKWYVYINRPMERGGIKVGITGVAEVDFNFYMQVGTETDPMPPIPDNIARHFTSDLRQIDPALTSGGGFMFGASLSIDLKPTFLCFYAELGMQIGFDMALKDVGAVSCAGMPDGQRIGINGWYATGQMYARIYGGVGIEVDVFFCQKCKFEAFGVEAGAVLQAGLPNPTWLKGGVYGEYRVLGGAISGSVSFQFAVGDECRLPADPLGGMAIVSDIKPSNGETNVDCGVVPVASFNMKYDELFSITERLSTTNTRTRTFQIKFERPVLTRVEGNAAVQGQVVRSDNRKSVSFAPNDYLQPEKQYRFSVSAYVQELINNEWVDFRQGGQVVRETRTTVFTTGPLPDVIRPADVAYSWPLHSHSSYLQESNGRKGFLYLNRAIPHVFSQPAPQGSRWEYFAEFQDTWSNGAWFGQTPLQVDAKAIRFNVPPMQNSHYLQVRFMKQLRAQPVTGSNGTFDPDAPVNVQDVVINTNNTTVVNQQDATVNTTTTNIEQTAIVANSQKELYHWYFTTDPHNTPQQKFAQVTAADYEAFSSAQNPSTRLRTRLNMPATDPREVKGFEYQYPAGTINKVPPMLSVTSAWDNTWQTQHAGYYLFDLSRQLWNSGLRLFDPFQYANNPYREKGIPAFQVDEQTNYGGYFYSAFNVTRTYYINDQSALHNLFGRALLKNALTQRFGTDYYAMCATMSSETCWKSLDILFNPAQPLYYENYSYNLHYAQPADFDMSLQYLGMGIMAYLGGGGSQLPAAYAPPVIASVRVQFNDPNLMLNSYIGALGGWQFTATTFTP